MRRRLSGGGEASHRRDEVDALEGHYVRMTRLRRMSAADLRALFAGDPARAAPWVESAARYGVAEAQSRFGQMRLDGTGVARDPDAALVWFTRAAKQGEAEAMNMVGRCWENGWGTTPDPSRAADWYRRAADAGCDWGEYNLANLLFDGRGIEGDLEAAVEGYQRAAHQGHARAMNLLARCLEEGWGTPRDAPLALDWYRRSAECGYFRAQYNYATLLFAAGRVADSLTWFEAACRAATPESLDGLIHGLIRHGDPRLANLGRRLGARHAVLA